MKSAKYVITIDGPAASGKTSVSRMLAKRHNWSWVSTGAFYRGLARIATHEGVSLEDETALAKLCLESFWFVRMTEEKTEVFLRQKDITEEIYREENGSAASSISRYPQVRNNLLNLQRACSQGVIGLVAEGRDCGTVVFPNAHVKIFLTAESDNRAKRRAQEHGKDVEETKISQVLRDLQDSSRKAAPMQVPAAAHVIDTSDLNLPQVVEIIDVLVRKELEI